MRYVAALAVLAAACASPAKPAPAPQAATQPAAPDAADAAVAPRGPVTITVLGTNDVHGALQRAPWFAGYVANARAARARDGGAVLVVDAGDMFQGTLESNLNEGAAIVDAFAAIGYTAAALGNHEFDFGPAGEASTPDAPGDDPRGALRARTAQAPFPMLAANIVDAATGAPLDLPNVAPDVLLEVAGVRVGIIGVSTIDTPRTTMAVNFAGLAMTPLADTIAARADALRRRGAAVVIVLAHAGGRCSAFDDPDDVSSCKLDGEIFQVASALPAGAVDVIVAGHTHAGIAHRVNGIAIIESFASFTAFGRVDLVVGADGTVDAVTIHPPRYVCARDAGAACNPGDYEGAPVQPVPRVAEVSARAIEAASAARAAPLGVTARTPIKRAYAEESALGNLFVDLMLAARPGADIAITNGGGLRADLPAGELTYGDLYEALPFDNRFAVVTLTGADLRAVVAGNLATGKGVFSIAGARVVATCKRGALDVKLTRANGKPIRDRDVLRVVTNEFLASGGDGAFGAAALPDGAIAIEDGPPIRDAMADVLRARGGTLAGEELHDPARPRLRYPGKRPVSCRP